MERLSTTEAKAKTTDDDQSMYATKESYIRWLEEISATRDSYNWGSDISSGRAMITATGHKKTTVEWLKEKQNKENGTWERIGLFNVKDGSGVLKGNLDNPVTFDAFVCCCYDGIYYSGSFYMELNSVTCRSYDFGTGVQTE